MSLPVKNQHKILTIKQIYSRFRSARIEGKIIYLSDKDYTKYTKMRLNRLPKGYEAVPSSGGI